MFAARKSSSTTLVLPALSSQIGVPARRGFKSTTGRYSGSSPFVPSKYSTSLVKGKTIYESKLGAIQQVTTKELSSLEGSNLSLQRLTLAPKATRSPSWTTNCPTITYCTKGTLLVSILDTNDVFGAFTISKGQMFTVQSGSIYYAENIGSEEAELITAFRNPQPEEISLWAGLGEFTPSVLGNSFGQPASVWSKIHLDTKRQFLEQASKNSASTIPSTANLPDPHKFDIEAQNPPTSFPYGTARLGRSQFWPELLKTNMAMYSLRVGETGMREAHWHPETTEMGYVASGSARMSILDPSGDVVTYYLKQGDCYIVPVSYPHQIETLGNDGFDFLVFFDQPTPQDIGYRTTGTRMERVMPAVVGVEPGTLPKFAFVSNDPLIVKRINPRDPIE